MSQDNFDEEFQRVFEELKQLLGKVAALEGELAALENAKAICSMSLYTQAKTALYLVDDEQQRERDSARWKDEKYNWQ